MAKADGTQHYRQGIPTTRLGFPVGTQAGTSSAPPPQCEGLARRVEAQQLLRNSAPTYSLPAASTPRHLASFSAAPQPPPPGITQEAAMALGAECTLPEPLDHIAKVCPVPPKEQTSLTAVTTAWCPSWCATPSEVCSICM